MFKLIKSWWQKKRQDQQRVEKWKADFEALNGRPVKFKELGEYYHDIKNGNPAPDLNTQSPVKQDKRTSAKALADWEDNLTVIWAGKTATIEFTYTNRDKKKTRRKVDPQELCVDQKNRLMLVGFCHVRGEKRTFNERFISTMIKVGSRRYDNLYEWAEEVLNIDVSPLLDFG